MLDLIILSGGLGTRSADPKVPKSLQTLVDHYTVLDSIADSVARLPIARVIPVLGHQADLQIEAFSSIKWRADLKIVFSERNGTSHAVRMGLQEVVSDNVLIVMGDSALAIPLTVHYEEWVKLNSHAMGLCRFSDHPKDSDAVIWGGPGKIVGLSRPLEEGETSPGSPLASLSGLVFSKKTLLTELPPSGSFQKNLVDLANKRTYEVNGKIIRYFSRDTGTASRLDQARKAFASGSATRRSLLDTGAIFIDRDGTMIPNSGDSRTHISSSDFPLKIRHEWKRINELGVPIFVVTNQPGVAKGRITEAQVLFTFLEIQRLLEETGAFFDDYRYCPHHPESGWPGEIEGLKIRCVCRKPGDGMLRDLAKTHQIDLTKSYVIGDTDADLHMANSVGATFLRVEANNPESVVEALCSAGKRLSNAS